MKTLVQPEKDRQKKVLIVDSEPAFAAVLQGMLTNYSLRHVTGVAAAMSILRNDEVDVVLLNWDQSFAGDRATQFLKAVNELSVAQPVIVFSCDNSRQLALEVIEHGALDFLVQPLDVQALKFALDQAYRRVTLLRELKKSRKLLSAHRIDGLLGNSKAMRHVCDVVLKVANVSTNVLITGESGTGKEVVARSIHKLSTRASLPFVAFSACALPESLMEDELFGHEKGAFTGANQRRLGRFEAAQGGTLFLDEIGDLALPLQAKLLRVLQERNLQRLGSNADVPLDVRVICATNKNLEGMVQEGTFRQDLYFRLSVVKVHLPPLRERMDDIPLLAEYFLSMFNTAHGKNVKGLSPSFLGALACYDWPGNVRELQNVIERSLVFAEGSQLTVEDLPVELQGFTLSNDLHKGSFHEAVRSFKRELVRAALRLHDGNKLRAARELKISRVYLHRLCNLLNIEEAFVADQEESQPGVRLAPQDERLVA